MLYLAFIPPVPKPPIVGIEYFDINIFMGQELGWLTLPTLFGLLFAAITFMIATYYIVRYTSGYFMGRKIPRSWKLILWGIFITAIAELGEMFAFYEWPNAGLIETNLLLMLPHALGGFLIGLGAYFLYREVKS